uniref:Uncharacterized protein n=1 Tax=Setaria digitata TaxID=48799 RepID=A0A915PT00_9BILA
MTGSTPPLIVPIMSETAILDATTDNSYLATSSHQQLHFSGTMSETGDHSPKSDISGNPKNRRLRINILHLLRRQMTKIASHNFYALQRRNKQSEICHNVPEVKYITEHDDSAEITLHDQVGNWTQSEEFSHIQKNDESHHFQPIPAVYQDPYCAVTVDRKTQSTRIIHTNDIATIFHVDNAGKLTGNICRPWGLSRNSVWWAADPQRSDSGREICLVVLQLKDHPILIGFTVINLVAFTDTLKICGLRENCEFIPSLPSLMESGVSGIRPHVEVDKKDTKTSSNEILPEDNMEENSKGQFGPPFSYH